MSCNTKTSLAAVIDAVNAQLNNNYIDRDDPRINQGVFTEPTIRGGLMLDEAAKLDFCGYVTECGQREPFGKQWVDRPLYPYNTLVSYEDGGEIKSRWQDIDDVVAGTGIGESYTTYEETRSLGLQGYTIIDSFELGATITQRDQALRHAATGKLYRWAGDLPKIVPAGSTPDSSGGVDTNAWLEVGDTALRQEILTGGLLTDAVIKTVAPVGGIERTLQSKNSDTINVKDFGAVGDGVTDDTAAFQTAVNYCQANKRALFVPDGAYLVSPITTVASSLIVSPLNIRGASWENTVIQAIAEQDEIFNISAQSNYSKFENLTLNGKGKAKVGVRSEGMSHSVFRDVQGRGFTEWGLCYLQNSWSSIFDNCKISYNSGHGMFLGRDCNGVVIRDSFIFLNEGWGIVAEGSLNIAVRGGGIEKNKAGGFYGNVLRLPSFQSVYFEANGAVGMTLDPMAGVEAPSLTVKTNILLNGVETVLTNYDKYFAGSRGSIPINTFSRGVSVKDCTASIVSGDISFITAISVEGMVVDNIVAAGQAVGLSDCVRLISILGRSRAQDFDIRNLKNFKNNLVVTTDRPYLSHALTEGIGTIKEGKQYNLVPKDLLSSVDLRYKAGADPLVVTDTTKKYMGFDIYEVRATVASLDNSKGKGFIFDADLPENAYLRGKECYVICLANAVGNARVETYYNLNGESTHVPVLTTQESGFYYRKTVRFTFPETGIVEVGFYLSNVTDIDTDYAEIAQLVFASVGVDYREL